MRDNWFVNIQTVYDPAGRKNALGNVYIIYKAIATSISKISGSADVPSGWEIENVGTTSITKIKAYADRWADMCVKISALTPVNPNPVPGNIGG